MKTNIYYLTALFLAISLYSADAQNFQWVKKAGGSGSDQSYGIAVDDLGNSYISGWFSDTAYFNGTTLISNGQKDVFLAKYDSIGVFQWVRQGGGPGSNTSAGITLDEEGNVFITGWFAEEIQFGDIILESYGSYDMFVVKYNNEGDVQWGRRAGGDLDDYGNRLTVNIEGDVIISGSFRGSAHFGESETIESYGDRDIFIALYGNDGTFYWVEQYGGKGEDRGYGIDCDAFGNIYFTGFFNGICFFGDHEIYSPAITSIYVTKLNAGGEFQWTKIAHGGANDFARGYGLSVDQSGNAYTTGFFTSCLTYPEDGLTMDATGGQYDFDIYINKFNSEGDLIWSELAGGNYMDQGRNLITDNEGNVYVTGFFKNFAEFGMYEAESIGIADIFIAKYNSDGVPQWVKNAGGAENDFGYGIGIDNKDNVLVTGVFHREALFDTLIIEGYEKNDIFIAKISVSGSGFKYPSFIKDFKLFPNPNNGTFTLIISSNKKINENVNVRIINSTGKIVYSDIMKINKEINNKTIHSDKLSTGIYFLELRWSNDVYSQKFIITKK
jgi:hypothetical protein